MVNTRSGRAGFRVRARSLMSDDGLPVERFELIRPLKRDYPACDLIAETSWVEAPDARFAEAWLAEAREAEATPRREAAHLATGLLLPVWDKLPDDHVQVIRIAAADGRSLLGREIPMAALGELGARLGLDLGLDLPADEIAATVLRTGKPLPVAGQEPLILKRALVNGSQRLELDGFSAARLAWYQGCFTEIIRYQTRLFVPVDRAAKVLESLIPQ